jgi:hypothetical protein
MERLRERLEADLPRTVPRFGPPAHAELKVSGATVAAEGDERVATEEREVRFGGAIHGASCS